jgi:DNA-binding PadR family transcriptional regulator
MAHATSRRGRKGGGAEAVTTADLVVLSLLEEQPMHGYDLLAAYQRQEVEDWTSVSKAQIYYALKKLDAEGMIRGKTASTGNRERVVYAVTTAGRSALRKGLARKTWATTRVAQPFTTWVGLSGHARAEDVASLVAQRRSFLQTEIAREEQSLSFIETLETDRAKSGAMIVRLVIAQLRTELSWLDQEFGP